MRARFGSPALRAKSVITLGLKTAEPFADGIAEAAEVPDGGFDAFSLGEVDELMTQSKMGIVSANHVVVRLGGGRRRTRFI